MDTIHDIAFRISIHAARVGCDCVNKKPLYTYYRFQSTQPEWAATDIIKTVYSSLVISIHAARVGCDRRAEIVLRAGILFQSTQPEWAATAEHLLH